jgi:ABC-type transport system involved in cytochrome c biogenesis permease component
MNSLAQLVRSSLLLHYRNRLALIYGYLFPAIFLAAFWVLYRHEPVPLLRHFGQLMTVTILGSACFGLPTTIVSERERGMWRRYRLTPTGLGHIVFGTVLARYLIILGAGILQLVLAIAAGMSAPSHSLELAVAFTFVAFALIGVGLMIATMADNVPAVQALGQCIFLPMLIIGGVAVPLSSLPEWAQKLSAFFPGRYAVASLQACTDGTGLASVRFDLLALAVLGAAGCFAGTKLFRWDAGQRFRSISGHAWLIPPLLAWLAIGGLAELRRKEPVQSEPVIQPTPVKTTAAAINQPPAPSPSPAPAVKTWTSITPAEIAALNYNVPPDEGVITPMAQPDERPDERTEEALNTFQLKLVEWIPGKESNPLQRTINLLSVAAVTDLAQDATERYVPLLIFDHLTITTPREQLLQLLAWIVLHPEQGETINDLTDLGLGGVAQTPVIRERVNLYATKFIARLNGMKLQNAESKTNDTAERAVKP